MSVRRYGNHVGEVDPNIRHEDRLAVTFYYAQTDPRTKPFYPYLFTDVFYELRQDDASEMLTRILHPEQSPSLCRLLRGRMEPKPAVQKPKTTAHKPNNNSLATRNHKVDHTGCL